MNQAARSEGERLAKRLNGYFHALFGAWLGATMVFWLQAWGPMRGAAADPFALPVLPWFAVSVAAGLACLVVPRPYYAVRDAERTVKLYERLGVIHLRRWITDGDYVRRRVRQIDPTYVVDGQHRSLEDRLEMTRGIERAHLAFLVFGLVSAASAGAAGWWSWAMVITLGNIAVNLLPALLQRYTRARVARLIVRRTSTALP